MTVCSKCNTWNPDSSTKCMNCGSELAGSVGGTAAPVVAPQKTPEQTVEDLGRRVEQGMRKIGESIEREITQEKHRLVKSWDRTFGLLAPVFSGAIGCFAILVAILVFDVFASSGEHRRFWDGLVDFAVEYLWLLVALTFMSSFQNYFNRNHRDVFRWISPALTAVAFAAWFWIFSQVMSLAYRESQEAIVNDLAAFFEVMMPVVFVLALGIGYSVQLMLRFVRKAAQGGPGRSG